MGRTKNWTDRAIACFDQALADVGLATDTAAPTSAARLLHVGNDDHDGPLPPFGRRRPARAPNPTLVVGRARPRWPGRPLTLARLTRRAHGARFVSDAVTHRRAGRRPSIVSSSACATRAATWSPGLRRRYGNTARRSVLPSHEKTVTDPAWEWLPRPSAGRRAAEGSARNGHSRPVPGAAPAACRPSSASSWALVFKLRVRGGYWTLDHESPETAGSPTGKSPPALCCTDALSQTTTSCVCHECA